MEEVELKYIDGGHDYVVFLYQNEYYISSLSNPNMGVTHIKHLDDFLSRLGTLGEIELPDEMKFNREKQRMIEVIKEGKAD